MPGNQLSYIGFKAAQDILSYQRRHTKSSLPLADERAFETALQQLRKRPGVREVLNLLPEADPFAPGLRPRMIADMIQSTKAAAAEVVQHYRALKHDIGTSDVRLITALNAQPVAHQVLGKMVQSIIAPHPADIYAAPVRAQLMVEMLDTISGRSTLS